ncbi:MAG: fibronectin type III domain-containing protein [Bacteroidota bacterium]
MKNSKPPIFLLLVLLCTYLAQGQNEVLVKAINCGGQQVTGSDGRVYMADASDGDITYSQGSGTLNLTNVLPDLTEPYHTSRYISRNVGTEFSCTIDNLVAGGTYRLVLHFAEPFHGVMNDNWDVRVFDVDINNGEHIIDDYNIMTQAALGIGSADPLDGARKVAKIDRSMTLSGTSLTIRFTNVSNDALVNAMEIYRIEEVQDVTAPTRPGRPVASNVTDTSMQLSWAAATDAGGIKSYRVQARKRNPNGKFQGWSKSLKVDVSGAGNGTVLTGLVPGTDYQLRVNATDHSGNSSSWSQVLSRTTAAAPSIAAPVASLGEVTAATVSLSWTHGGNVAATGYRVYTGDTVLETLGTVTEYTATALDPETEYSFSVSALDANGDESGRSNTVTATTLAAPAAGALSVWTASGSDISFTDGNVGIGTASPDVRLAVNGHIRAREIKVETANWPDYVFAKDYELPTLEEVQRHIQEKGHLPHIPSAAEVEADGLKVGEMNRLLLEKIEELTLYVLEQEERINKLERFYGPRISQDYNIYDKTQEVIKEK